MTWALPPVKVVTIVPLIVAGWLGPEQVVPSAAGQHESPIENAAVTCSAEGNGMPLPGGGRAALPKVRLKETCWPLTAGCVGCTFERPITWISVSCMNTVLVEIVPLDT